MNADDFAQEDSTTSEFDDVSLVSPPVDAVEHSAARFIDGDVDDAPAEEHPGGLGDIETYSIDEAIELIGIGPFQLILIIAVMPVWLADACEMVLLSFLGPAVTCEWDLLPAQEAMITSTVFVGMLIGSSFWGVFNDHFGRKLGFALSTVMTFIFALATVFAPSFAFLLALRCGVGFGLGGSHVAVTILSEWLPAAQRGRFVILLELSWAVGVALEGLSALIIMPNSPPSLGWRILTLVSAIPLVVIMLTLPLVPSSPRFLLSKGKRELALKALERAARWNGKTLPPGELCIDAAKSTLSGGGDGGDGYGGGALRDGDEKQDDKDVAIERGARTNPVPAHANDRAAEQLQSQSRPCQMVTALRAQCSRCSDYCVHRSPDARVVVHLGQLTQRANNWIDQRCCLCNASQIAPRPVQFAAWLWSKLTLGMCGPGLSLQTCLFCFIWFANALNYYAIVLLSTALPVQQRSGHHCAVPTGGGEPAISGSGSGAGGMAGNASAIPGGAAACAATLTESDYFATMLGSFAELPGVIIAFFVVDILGRKRSMSVLLAITGASTFLIALCLGTALEAAILAVGRAAIAAAFQILFVITPESYGTKVRSSAIGVLSSLSRIGGGLSPFLVNVLMKTSDVAALLLLTASLLGAALLSLMLPKETAGLEMGGADVDSSGVVADRTQLLDESPTDIEELLVE